MQRRACAAPDVGQASQPTPNAGRVHMNASALTKYLCEPFRTPARTQITVVLWGVFEQLLQFLQHLSRRFPVRTTAWLRHQPRHTVLLEQQSPALHRGARGTHAPRHFGHTTPCPPKVEDRKCASRVVPVSALLHHCLQLAPLIARNLYYTALHRVASSVVGQMLQSFRSPNATRVPSSDQYFQSGI